MSKEKLLKIIDEINNAKLPTIHFIEDKIDVFHRANPKLIKENLDIDEHRWYKISTSVYKIGDWFLGIRGASKSYSEMTFWEDLCVETVAFEMEEIPSVTYRKKD